MNDWSNELRRRIRLAVTLAVVTVAEERVLKEMETANCPTG